MGPVAFRDRRSRSTGAHAQARVRVLTQAAHGGGFVARYGNATFIVGNKGPPTASQAAVRVHCQGQKDGESMSGTRDQAKNGIPELTVSVPVLPETVAGESLQYSP